MFLTVSGWIVFLAFLAVLYWYVNKYYIKPNIKPKTDREVVDEKLDQIHEVEDLDKKISKVDTKQYNKKKEKIEKFKKE